MCRSVQTTQAKNLKTQKNVDVLPTSNLSHKTGVFDGFTHSNVFCKISESFAATTQQVSLKR